MISERMARLYCKDFTKIENYDKAVADTTRIWDCHHRLETHNSDGERRSLDLTVKELKALGTFYDRPPEELIFLTRVEHSRLHMGGRPKSEEHIRKVSEVKKGHIVSEETRRKLSKANKGRKMPEEFCKKVSEGLKGHFVSEECRRRIAETFKGKHWKLVDGKRVWY